MCASTYDYHYPAFGGRITRADRVHGRVGSLMGTVVSPAPYRDEGIVSEEPDSEGEMIAPPESFEHLPSAEPQVEEQLDLTPPDAIDETLESLESLIPEAEESDPLLDALDKEL